MSSEPIGPGDFVECVDATPCPKYGPNGLVAKGVYLVEKIRPAPVHSGWVLDLKELCSPGPLGGFGVHRFRPIYRPKADLIERLMAPAPELEGVS